MSINSEYDRVKQYTHDEQKRLNNPPVGLVTAETDRLNGKKTYQFDPHVDPQLQWAGKAEGISYDVDTVSLHVHERIDPLTIIEVVRKREMQEQQSLSHYFETSENNPPIRDAIEFYKHSQGWSNRLIAGDSLLVMNSLLEKESMAGKIQMIYIDPPYGITYKSNFQPFVNQREVSDRKDEDLTQEPEMVKAFRDTWELGTHSYLTYLRNRLLLACRLLHESGSCFVQISDVNLHHVREIMDEIFGSRNFVRVISFRKRSMALTTSVLPKMDDFVVWYAKDIDKAKFRDLFVSKEIEDDTEFAFIDTEKNGFRRLTNNELLSQKFISTNTDKIFKRLDFCASGYTKSTDFPIELNGKTFHPRTGVSWKTNREGVKTLLARNRIFSLGKGLYYKIYYRDFHLTKLTNLWRDTRGEVSKVYVLQTSEIIVQRCMLMTTDPGDLVFDPTCGSGTTAVVAEQWGRRWMTCDTSRVALAIAKQRLITKVFDYYTLLHPSETVDSGFKYEEAPHITLGSITNDEPLKKEKLYDKPIVDPSKVRVCGPFTLEAVPSPMVKNLEEIDRSAQEADVSIARSGPTLSVNEWIDEMLSTGIRGKSGQVLQFARIEPLSGTKWIHAGAETKDGKNAVISFGPEYAPLEQRQVELAIEEAQELVPKPMLVIFASFQFDPEAAKDIEELKWPGVDVLKVQMNTDLFTSDLKKKRSSNESFWLIGQPDLEIRRKGENFQVVVNGFDYYNTKSGEIESGDASKIAMWELDGDYDGRSMYPRQVFFPMAGLDNGWSKLAKNLKAQIDEELIEKYRGNKSLPFKLGNNKQIAVKIIDDRGVESLKIVRLKE
jgi:adenine-specific DNA-methyltransferase